MKPTRDTKLLRIFLVLLMVFISARAISQEIELSVHVDPLITWMSTNSEAYNSNGARAGISFGLNVLYFFEESYALSTGLEYLVAGGSLSGTESYVMVFTNFNETVAAGDEVIYNLRYLNIPAGIRLYFGQIGKISPFIDPGFDIRARLSSKADIPQNQILDENANTEVNFMNLGWHIHAGAEYEVAPNLSLVGGLGFDMDFFDVTKDLSDVGQPEDKSGLRMIRIRLGVKF